MMKEEIVQDLTRPMKMLKKCMRNLMHSDRRFSIGAMAVQLNLDKEIARQVVSDDLSTKNVPAMMVSRLLTDEQEQHRVDAFSSLSIQTNICQKLSLEMEHDL
jgi:hypothetical protein